MTKTRETVLYLAAVSVGVAVLIGTEPSALAAWIAAAILWGLGVAVLAVARSREVWESARKDLISAAAMVAAVLAVSVVLNEGRPDWRYAGYLALLLALPMCVTWIVRSRVRLAGDRAN